MLDQISFCLAALYLRGLPRPVNLVRRKWVRVLSSLRSAACTIEAAPEVLRAVGFVEEALVLENGKFLDSCREEFQINGVVTAVHPAYPIRWMERLGEAAPPALWIRGTLPEQKLIGIVGSRRVERPVREFARAVGQEAVRLGYAIVSGGAAGCDHGGAKGALAEDGGVIEILPYGIDRYTSDTMCGLSVCSPGEAFSTASAMERNTLIYAASELTVVVHARFKEGGTWVGAAEASRRHLCPLIVRDDGSPASRALIGLGGTPITDPLLLPDAIASPPAQRGLFGIG